MVVQGRARQRAGAAQFAKYVGFGVLGIIVIAVLWSSAMWAYHRTVGYDIKGEWRAESTAVLGFQLPIGLNIAFDETSARILDQQVKVVEYGREGNQVHVAVQADPTAQLNLVFTFEDRDHMVFEGPLGLSARYRRVKNVK